MPEPPGRRPNDGPATWLQASGGTAYRRSALRGLLSLTLYFIMDFEYPRLGMITMDTSDQLFEELRAGMD